MKFLVGLTTMLVKSGGDVKRKDIFREGSSLGIYTKNFRPESA